MSGRVQDPPLHVLNPKHEILSNVRFCVVAGLVPALFHHCEARLTCLCEERSDEAVSLGHGWVQGPPLQFVD